MKRTKVTMASLILLLLVALVSMLLLPSQVAMARDPAVELTKRTLQGVSDELGWGAMLQNLLHPVTGNGFFIENIVKEVAELPGVAAVGGGVAIQVFASNEEALQETKKWHDRFVESIQTTAFHGYQALRYTREKPPISGFGWFCGRIWLDTYVLRPGEFPQSLEEIAEVLHQAALANGLYHYCEPPEPEPEPLPRRAWHNDFRFRYEQGDLVYDVVKWTEHIHRTERIKYVEPGNHIAHRGEVWGVHNTGFVVYVSKGQLRYQVLTYDTLSFSGTLDTAVKSVSENLVRFAKRGKYGVTVTWTDNQGKGHYAVINQHDGLIEKGEGEPPLAPGVWHNDFRFRYEQGDLVYDVVKWTGYIHRTDRIKYVKPGDHIAYRGEVWGIHNTGFVVYVSKGQLRYQVLTYDTLSFSGILDTAVKSVAENLVRFAKRGKYGVTVTWTDNQGKGYYAVIDQFEGLKEKGTLRLDKTVFYLDEEIRVYFEASSGFDNSAWIGIIPSNLPHGSEAENEKHVLARQFLKKRTAGALIFKAPKQPGSYDFRMHDTDSNGREVASVSFEIKAPEKALEGRLRLDVTAFYPDDEIRIHFGTSRGFPDTAWIGIIPSNVPHGSEAENEKHVLARQFLKKRTAGTLIFKAPKQPGSYDFRMHDTDHNGREVASVSFEIEEIIPPLADFGTLGKEVIYTGYTGGVQVWQVLPEFSKPGRYRVSIKHAVKEVQGAFYITAWADTNGDGIPDKEIGRSDKKIASRDGQWSSWEFSSNYTNIFIGYCWDENGGMIYYQMGGTLEGYIGLGNTNFYSRQLNGIPKSRVSPRYTNIRVERIRQ